MPEAAAGIGVLARPAPAVVTGLLVLAQIALWLVVVFLYPGQHWVDLAMLPSQFDLPRMLVASFVHVHPFHLGLNVALLWLFGSPLERAVGASRFLGIYLGAALFAGVMFWAVTTAAQLHLLAAATSGAPPGAVGASGAIAGVLGAYCVRLPHRPLRIGPLSLPPAPLMAVWLVWEFLSAVSGTAAGTISGAGHWAHFAGFTFGLAAGQLTRMHSAARGEELVEIAQGAAMHGDHGRAAAALAAMLEIDPRDTAVRGMLVRERLALRDRVGAETAARDGLTLAVRERDAASAIRAYRETLSVLTWIRLPDGVRLRIGSWLAERGDYAAAYVALIESAREDAATPGAAAALFRAGEIAADHLDDPRRARRAWQRILLDYSESAWRDQAYNRLGRLSGRDRDRGAGEATAEKPA